MVEALSTKTLRYQYALYYVSHLFNTVNCEYFVVKIFSDSLPCVKIKHAKIHNIDDNAVQGRLSENYLTRKLLHDIF